MPKLKPLRFVPPPPCLPIPWTDLKAGDCILQHGEMWYSGLIQDVTDSPWSHAAMVVKCPATGALWIAEQTSPKLRMTPLPAWLASESGVYVCQMQSDITDNDGFALWNWWASKVGQSYDYALLIHQLIPAWWQRIAIRLHLPMRYRFLPALAVLGVCSTCVADAYKSIGLPIDEGGTSTMTPGDLPRQKFLAEIRMVMV